MRQYRDITILGRCNLSCQYCDHPDFSVCENQVIQSLDVIMKRFERDKMCFRIESRGEITLYPHIINHIKNYADKGYRLELLSNGLLIDDVLNDYKKIGCVISLDGHTTKMNEMRGLSQSQVNRILNNIFKYDADIQMVYLNQSAEEINAFIRFLQDNHFKGLLHIFPCSLKNKNMSKCLSYDDLIHTEFIPPKEYFERWKYIYENNSRNFICDFYKNGYIYYIFNRNIKMAKCDGNASIWRILHPLGNERNVSIDCLNCINNNEFNNQRKFVALN
ncbi:neomycin C epimerase [Clostridiales bacterium]|nr:radical SAM protein [Clostridiales bacterium]GFI56219.1 neomycin C epimerase [Clostridiales bacterium]